MRSLALVVAASAHISWEQFKADFGKAYETEEEHDLRKEVFAANLDFIDRHNAEGHSYKLGVTAFADLTSEEFRQTRFGYSGSLAVEGGTLLGDHVAAGSVPDSVDWRGKGAVTPVKNQERCGSCWAFSSTGALEGAFFLAGGKLVSLSEQQLVDCAKFRYGNMGCSGGRQVGAFNYAEKNAMDTEASYAYSGKSGLLQHCEASSGTTGIPAGDVTGYKTVTGGEAALQSAVAQQPVAIAIEADHAVFQHYTSGIVTGSACGAQLDHAVLAVGYGEDAGKQYWLVKNSWGASWGEQGYVRLARGSDECGITNGPPVYPVVQAKAAPEVVV